MDCWLAARLASWLAVGLGGLAGLAGRSVWIPGFGGRRLGPWSPPRTTLGDVGGFSKFDPLQF